MTEIQKLCVVRKDESIISVRNFTDDKELEIKQ